MTDDIDWKERALAAEAALAELTGGVVHNCAAATEDDYVCLDCARPTDDFWVEDALWYGAVPENNTRMAEGKFTFVCIDCFEKRIGRRLRASDFPECPANAIVLKVFERIAALETMLRVVRRHFVCRCGTSYTSRGRHAPECLAYELADLDAALAEETPLEAALKEEAERG